MKFRPGRPEPSRSRDALLLAAGVILAFAATAGVVTVFVMGVK